MLPNSTKPDTLNEIGVLKRREIEARIVAPLLDALGKEFGRDRVVEIARQVIVDVARQQGAALCVGMGDKFPPDLCPKHAAGKRMMRWRLRCWSPTNSAMPSTLLVVVTRKCIALSASPNSAQSSLQPRRFLIEGFNPDVAFTRTQTLMQGADYCDF